MIDQVTQGSLAKNGKLNEVIEHLNSIIDCSVIVSELGDGDADRPGFHVTSDNSILVLPPQPDGYVETAVTLCQDGSPVAGSILFKADE